VASGTSTPVRSPSDQGWWAVDVAAYLLTRLAGLARPIAPSKLEVDDMIAWIRDKELPWAPGCADLRSLVPWNELRNQTDDPALIDFVLQQAANEVDASLKRNGPDDICPFSARRFLSRSTLAAYGVTVGGPETDGACADGHVHQGAALPIDLTLHWAAGQVAGIDRASGSPGPLLMKDTDGQEFNCLPLLLLHRTLVEDPRRAETDGVLELAVAATTDDRESWDELNHTIGFDHVRVMGIPTNAGLCELKNEARSASWTPWRQGALFRVEAILHGAITQRVAGLDVFVEQFEKLAQVRRARIPKPAYFEASIKTHASQSGHSLRRLELRLGEPISIDPKDKRAVENDYAAALEGYLAHVKGQSDPIRVTFPWGLVKSLPQKAREAENWRYNPNGIYALTEVILDVLGEHPALAPFVDGIDVCGNEEGDPNWLFAPAFRRFATATADLTPAPTCRFHAGESQWTPLHGLRRIAEFMRFELSPRAPRRLGHGLAMFSTHWARLETEPADELFDDLLWARGRLEDIDRVARSTIRMVDRLILDLRPVIYADEEARSASVPELIRAYEARFDIDDLEAISFLEQEKSGRLSFPDRQPAPRSEPRLRLLKAHLEKRPPSPAIAALLTDASRFPGVSVQGLQSTLHALWEVLGPEVADDVRWGGVVVEVCPTSNVMVGDIRGLSRHPMREMVRSGMLATINSDDPSIFHSWVPEELDHAKSRMNVPTRQVRSAQELSLRIVAPALDGVDIETELRTAITSLKGIAAA
jgi:hypothetical protein